MLLLRSEHGWALPWVEVEGYAEDDLRPACGALERLLGVPVTVLRRADRAQDEPQRLLELVYVLAMPEPVVTPPAAEWVDRDALADLPLSKPGHRDLVDRCLHELEQGPVPAQRVPWAREGWRAEAAEWIAESLAARGRPPTGRIEQLRVWGLSCVLRVPTADGVVFFKATAGSPLFVDEGHVMRGLARLYPENVPKPLAIDTKRRWMLLDDLGPALGWNAPLDERELVLRMFALIQVVSTERVQELLAIGCVDRRPEWLARQVGKLLADDQALAGLEDGELAALHALRPKLETMCRRLAHGGVPSALVHGDLHLGNVARVDGRYVFFDWTDACVTHPFFDPLDVFHERDDAVRTRLRDAYLSMWLEYEPMDRLLELWSDAERLASLHHAVSYRHILANVEPGAASELEWALPYFLRKILEAETVAR